MPKIRHFWRAASGRKFNIKYVPNQICGSSAEARVNSATDGTVDQRGAGGNCGTVTSKVPAA